jgi:ATP-dependent DNA helicase RecQ
VATYVALLQARTEAGRLVPGPVLARRVKGARSDAEVYSALRILSDAGCVETPARRGACRVRWIAGRRRVRELVAGEGDLSEGARATMRELAAASAGASRRLVQLPLRRLARSCGGEPREARAALDELQAAGILGWRDGGRGGGYSIQEPARDPEALPVDWARIAARRAFDLRKLKRMEGYAFSTGCRRRYVLRYFGEDGSAGRCGGCDRCGVRS